MVLFNDEGGIIDDLMVMCLVFIEDDGWLMLVVNVVCKDVDYVYFCVWLLENVKFEVVEDWVLIVVQGLEVVVVVVVYVLKVVDFVFMFVLLMEFDGIDCYVVCVGYIGEDGVEMLVLVGVVEVIVCVLFVDDWVEVIGFGVCDSLCLEVGFCFYGYDIDEIILLVEGNIIFCM